MRVTRHGWLARGLVVAGVVAGATFGSAATAFGFAGADRIQDAPPLLFSIPGVVTNEFFTDNLGDPAQGGGPKPCPAPMTHTAWWRIAGTGKQIDLTTANSDFDTELAVYDVGGGAPLVGNRVVCAAGDPVTMGTTAAASFASERGKAYLVEVGSQNVFNGTIDLRASSPVRPGNDDQVSPQVLATGVPAAAGNLGASQEQDETLACGATSYAATVWFRWTAPAIGDAVFSSAAAFDTVATVYRAADRAIVGCAAASDRAVAVRVAAGDYLVQVGSRGTDVAGLPDGPITVTAAFAVDPDLDNDGVLASSDCNDNDPAIRPGVVDVPDDGIDQNCDGVDAVNLDRDGDGFLRPGDCNDANPKIHPQVRDIPGNKIDEDCTDGPAPFARLSSNLERSWAFPPFHFTRLQVTHPVAGSRVELRCKGRGCPRRSKVVNVRRSSSKPLSVLGYVRRARLKRGAVLDVRITKGGFIGLLERFTIRGPRNPRIREYCLPPGDAKPRAC
jgi:hypothetical protein